MYPIIIPHFRLEWSKVKLFLILMHLQLEIYLRL